MDASKGWFSHDGRFATLPNLVDHHDRHVEPDLSDGDKHELVEYLKSP